MTYTLVQSDGFTDTDGTNLGSHTPDNALGGTGSYVWQQVTGSGWITQSNRGINPGTPALYLAVINAPAVTDCRVSGAVYGSAVPSSPVAVVARYEVATGKFYMFDPYLTDARIFYFDGGSFNLIKTTTFAGFADGDEIAIVCNGTTISGEVNGVQVVTIGDGSIASGKPGMYSPGSSTGFDSWKYQTGTAPVVTATKLGISTALVGNQTNVAFSTQPVIAVQDSGGATVTSDTSTVTATLTVISGSGTLIGTPTKAAVAGLAAFSGLGVNGTGSFQITYSDGALTTVTTPTFYVGAAKVHITSQPTTAFSKRVHGNIVVAVQDGNGVTVGNATNSVTIALTVVSGIAVLAVGTLTRAAVAGVATFNDLAVTCSEGAIWTYAVSASGLTGDTSSPITGSVSVDIAVTIT